MPGPVRSDVSLNNNSIPDACDMPLLRTGRCRGLGSESPGRSPASEKSPIPRRNLRFLRRRACPNPAGISQRPGLGWRRRVRPGGPGPAVMTRTLSPSHSVLDSVTVPTVRVPAGGLVMTWTLTSPKYSVLGSVPTVRVRVGYRRTGRRGLRGGAEISSKMAAGAAASAARDPGSPSRLAGFKFPVSPGRGDTVQVPGARATVTTWQ